jgi:hypothetical protein
MALQANSRWPRKLASGMDVKGVGVVKSTPNNTRKSNLLGIKNTRG